MVKRKDIRFASIVKKWLNELNGEKLLLAASVVIFCLTMLSLREKSLQDTFASERSRAKQSYMERIKDYLCLPGEIQIPKQKISDIVLPEPQTIFLGDDQSNKKESAFVSLSRNPFFPEDFNPPKTSPGKKVNDVVIEKEEFLFVGIMNLREGSAALNVVLKGSRSGQYRILSEGDELDEIKILSIDRNSARIANRKGMIQDYTTAPKRFTIK